MQMPATRQRIGKPRPAHQAHEIAVASGYLFERAAKQDHGVTGGDASLGGKREFILAGTKLDFQRLQRQPERDHVLTQNLKNWRDLIVAALGQILIAMRCVAHQRRFGRPVQRVRPKPRVFYFEQVKFKLDAGDIIETRLCQLGERVAIKLSGCDRDLPAIVKIAIAQNPAGIRGPWQRTKGARIGEHDKIAGSAHFWHLHSGARLKDRENRPMRCILGQQRAGHGDAVAERVRRLAGKERLATQDAVLVRE